MKEIHGLPWGRRAVRGKDGAQTLTDTLAAPELPCDLFRSAGAGAQPLTSAELERSSGQQALPRTPAAPRN